MSKKSMVVSNQTVIALTLRQWFIGMTAICGSLFMSCEMAYATDLIMSQEETQCIQHLTPGGNGAQSISVQCASIVFIADKDTSVIYMCSAIVGTNFNVQQGRFIGGLPPNGGFFCRRDIVPTPPPFVCYYLAKKSYRYDRCSRRPVDTKHGRVKLEY